MAENSITDHDKRDIEIFKSPTGMNYRAKLIGVESVVERRGSLTCENAMAKLKMEVLASRQHKKVIWIRLKWNEIEVMDEFLKETIHVCPLAQISYVWKDTHDSRAFGVIRMQPDSTSPSPSSSSSPEASEQPAQPPDSKSPDKESPPPSPFLFYAYKTEKASMPVILSLKQLFTLKAKLSGTTQSDESGVAAAVAAADQSDTSDGGTITTADSNTANASNLVDFDVADPSAPATAAVSAAGGGGSVTGGGAATTGNETDLLSSSTAGDLLSGPLPTSEAERNIGDDLANLDLSDCRSASQPQQQQQQQQALLDLVMATSYQQATPSTGAAGVSGAVHSMANPFSSQSAFSMPPFVGPPFVNVAAASPSGSGMGMGMGMGTPSNNPFTANLHSTLAGPATPAVASCTPSAQHASSQQHRNSLVSGVIMSSNVNSAATSATTALPLAGTGMRKGSTLANQNMFSDLLANMNFKPSSSGSVVAMTSNAPSISAAASPTAAYLVGAGMGVAATPVSATANQINQLNQQQQQKMQEPMRFAQMPQTAQGAASGGATSNNIDLSMFD